MFLVCICFLGFLCKSASQVDKGSDLIAYDLGLYAGTAKMDRGLAFPLSTPSHTAFSEAPGISVRLGSTHREREILPTFP